MRRTAKFLLRPTARQTAALTAMLDDHRALYNAALQERRDAYRMRTVSIRYGDQSAQLKDIRRADPDGQGRWSFSSQQATLRRLNRAFDSFFRRVRSGQTPGFPRFKGAGWFDTVEWPADRDGCRWDSVTGEHRVYLQGAGHIRVHQHRALAGHIKTISVKREGRRWYVVLSCDDVPAAPLPATGRVVGIDLGVASFLTTSDGQHVANPRHLRAAAEKLAAAQRALSRCQRGSKRRRAVRARVAAVHARVRRQRLDHAHKVTNRLVAHHDVICHEALRISNMCRSARGTAQTPGTRVAQKAGLNRSILDAGWGVFLSILAAKAESAGRELIAVDPRNTSRTCPSCGHCAADNRVTRAEFRCARCGLQSHADLVGAVNVLRAGLARRDAATAAQREATALKRWRGHQFLPALVTASDTVRTRSTTRGPQREATSSSSATTSPLRTAASCDQPGRVATDCALWPQHFVSARKTRSGLDSTIFSADSCG
jgi:putative transposase